MGSDREKGQVEGQRVLALLKSALYVLLCAYRYACLLDGSSGKVSLLVGEGQRAR